MTPTPAAVSDSLLTALVTARTSDQPYRHWFLENALPPAALDEIATLPFPAPEIDETFGRRETHNSARIFFSAENRGRYPVVAAIAEALQDARTVRRLAEICDAPLIGGLLRIEYCQDRDGFWLESHTDIATKLFTMLVYLDEAPPGEDWGTDIYDGEQRLVTTAPFHRNAGLVFIPGDNTWHGFRRRPITGVRHSLIVNYVRTDWRSVHELAFPAIPVG